MIEVLPLNSTELGIRFKYDPLLVERVKGLPQRRWDKDKRAWVFKPTIENIEFVRKWFPTAVWDAKCETFEADALVRKDQREATKIKKATGALDFDSLAQVPFKMKPKNHQKIALLLGRDMPAFAYFMDQGTGKTKVLIDDAAHNYRAGRINALLVIAPNSVKTNWLDPDGSDDDEITKHMPPDVDYNAACWVSNPTKDQKKLYQGSRRAWGDVGCLHILIVNVEAIQFDRVEQELREFCLKHKVMIAVDESTRIKHRQAQRTKTAMKLRQFCPMARIATGTPVIKSPLNAFSQMKFLDPDIIGYSNYRSFENHFAVKGGYGGYQVLTYQNLDELQDCIDKVSYRVLKDDCLDLEPKVYQKRMVPLGGEQLRIYRELKENSIVEIESMVKDGYIEATIVLTKYLRLQQITSGFVPVLDEAGQSTGYSPFSERPPKIEEALNIIDECQGKVIVWCRFIPEIRMMANALHKSNIPFVEFHGAISEADRLDARRSFQTDGDSPKVFIGQIQTGGVGITLNKARTVIYLSNTFNTEDRVQSEDRAHRIGTEGSVTYIDLIAPGTVDQHIIRSLLEDKKLSDLIMRDGVREWI